MKRTAPTLRIGIDFDNTIITYDEVFCAAAERDGLIEHGFAGRKQAVRDAIRLLPDGELAWQRLQGQVYGKGIAAATLMPGIKAFLRRCQRQGCAVSIVSHKTEYGHFDPERVNLRQAALDWMTAQNLFDGSHAIAPQDVYFESTRKEKLARIASLSLTHFIDDLEEVLTDPAFPSGVARVLLGETATDARFAVCRCWQEVERKVFDGAGV